MANTTTRQAPKGERHSIEEHAAGRGAPENFPEGLDLSGYSNESDPERYQLEKPGDYVHGVLLGVFSQWVEKAIKGRIERKLRYIARFENATLRMESRGGRPEQLERIDVWCSSHSIKSALEKLPMGHPTFIRRTAEEKALSGGRNPLVVFEVRANRGVAPVKHTIGNALIENRDAEAASDASDDEAF